MAETQLSAVPGWRQDNAGIAMLKRQRIILALLAGVGAQLNRTRFVKLIFLLRQETPRDHLRVSTTSFRTNTVRSLSPFIATLKYSGRRDISKPILV